MSVEKLIQILFLEFWSNMPQFIIFLFLALFIRIDCDTACERKLEDVKIIPKYADYGTAGDLQVVYNDNYAVQCGKHFPIMPAKNSPVVTYDPKENGGVFSILMFDPDTPHPMENKRIYLHWFVVNIPPKVMRNGYNRQTGREIASYFPPLAPTGNHRYTFCVYRQQRCIPKCRKTPKYNSMNRFGNHPRDLAEQYDLGSPLSCTFYYLTSMNTTSLAEKPIARNISDTNKELGNRDKTKLAK